MSDAERLAAVTAAAGLPFHPNSLPHRSTGYTDVCAACLATAPAFAPPLASEFGAAAGVPGFSGYGYFATPAADVLAWPLDARLRVLLDRDAALCGGTAPSDVGVAPPTDGAARHARFTALPFTAAAAASAGGAGEGAGATAAAAGLLAAAAVPLALTRVRAVMRGHPRLRRHLARRRACAVHGTEAAAAAAAAAAANVSNSKSEAVLRAGKKKLASSHSNAGGVSSASDERPFDPAAIAAAAGAAPGSPSPAVARYASALGLTLSNSAGDHNGADAKCTCSLHRVRRDGDSAEGKDAAADDEEAPQEGAFAKRGRPAGPASGAVLMAAAFMSTDGQGGGLTSVSPARLMAALQQQQQNGNVSRIADDDDEGCLPALPAPDSAVSLNDNNRGSNGAFVGLPVSRSQPPVSSSADSLSAQSPAGIGGSGNGSADAGLSWLALRHRRDVTDVDARVPTAPAETLISLQRLTIAPGPVRPRVVVLTDTEDDTDAESDGDDDLKRQKQKTAKKQQRGRDRDRDSESAAAAPRLRAFAPGAFTSRLLFNPVDEEFFATEIPAAWLHTGGESAASSPAACDDEAPFAPFTPAPSSALPLVFLSLPPSQRLALLSAAARLCYLCDHCDFAGLAAWAGSLSLAHTLLAPTGHLLCPRPRANPLAFFLTDLVAAALPRAPLAARACLVTALATRGVFIENLPDTPAVAQKKYFAMVFAKHHDATLGAGAAGVDAAKKELGGADFFGPAGGALPDFAPLVRQLVRGGLLLRVQNAVPPPAAPASSSSVSAQSTGAAVKGATHSSGAAQSAGAGAVEKKFMSSLVSGNLSFFGLSKPLTTHHRSALASAHPEDATAEGGTDGARHNFKFPAYARALPAAPPSVQSYSFSAAVASATAAAGAATVNASSSANDSPNAPIAGVTTPDLSLLLPFGRLSPLHVWVIAHLAQAMPLPFAATPAGTDAVLAAARRSDTSAALNNKSSSTAADRAAARVRARLLQLSAPSSPHLMLQTYLSHYRLSSFSSLTQRYCYLTSPAAGLGMPAPRALLFPSGSAGAAPMTVRGGVARLPAITLSGWAAGEAYRREGRWYELGLLSAVMTLLNNAGNAHSARAAAGSGRSKSKTAAEALLAALTAAVAAENNDSDKSRDADGKSSTGHGDNEGDDDSDDEGDYGTNDVVAVSVLGRKVSRLLRPYLRYILRSQHPLAAISPFRRRQKLLTAGNSSGHPAAPLADSPVDVSAALSCGAPLLSALLAVGSPLAALGTLAAFPLAAPAWPTGSAGDVAAALPTPLLRPRLCPRAADAVSLPALAHGRSAALRGDCFVGSLPPEGPLLPLLARLEPGLSGYLALHRAAFTPLAGTALEPVSVSAASASSASASAASVVTVSTRALLDRRSALHALELSTGDIATYRGDASLLSLLTELEHVAARVFTTGPAPASAAASAAAAATAAASSAVVVLAATKSARRSARRTAVSANEHFAAAVAAARAYALREHSAAAAAAAAATLSRPAQRLLALSARPGTPAAAAATAVAPGAGVPFAYALMRNARPLTLTLSVGETGQEQAQALALAPPLPTLTAAAAAAAAAAGSSGGASGHYGVARVRVTPVSLLRKGRGVAAAVAAVAVAYAPAGPALIPLPLPPLAAIAAASGAGDSNSNSCTSNTVAAAETGTATLLRLLCALVIASPLTKAAPSAAAAAAAAASAGAGVCGVNTGESLRDALAVTALATADDDEGSDGDDDGVADERKSESFSSSRRRSTAREEAAAARALTVLDTFTAAVHRVYLYLLLLTVTSSHTGTSDAATVGTLPVSAAMAHLFSPLVGYLDPALAAALPISLKGGNSSAAAAAAATSASASASASASPAGGSVRLLRVPPRALVSRVLDVYAAATAFFDEFITRITTSSADVRHSNDDESTARGRALELLAKAGSADGLAALTAALNSAGARRCGRCRSCHHPAVVAAAAAAAAAARAHSRLHANAPAAASAASAASVASAAGLPQCEAAAFEGVGGLSAWDAMRLLKLAGLPTPSEIAAATATTATAAAEAAEAASEAAAEAAGRVAVAATGVELPWAPVTAFRPRAGGRLLTTRLNNNNISGKSSGSSSGAAAAAVSSRARTASAAQLAVSAARWRARLHQSVVALALLLRQAPPRCAARALEAARLASLSSSSSLSSLQSAPSAAQLRLSAMEATAAYTSAALTLSPLAFVPPAAPTPASCHIPVPHVALRDSNGNGNGNGSACSSASASVSAMLPSSVAESMTAGTGGAAALTLLRALRRVAEAPTLHAAAAELRALYALATAPAVTATLGTASSASSDGDVAHDSVAASTGTITNGGDRIMPEVSSTVGPRGKHHGKGGKSATAAQASLSAATALAAAAPSVLGPLWLSQPPPVAPALVRAAAASVADATQDSAHAAHGSRTVAADAERGLGGSLTVASGDPQCLTLLMALHPRAPALVTQASALALAAASATATAGGEGANHNNSGLKKAPLFAMTLPTSLSASTAGMLLWLHGQIASSGILSSLPAAHAHCDLSVSATARANAGVEAAAAATGGAVGVQTARVNALLLVELIRSHRITSGTGVVTATVTRAHARSNVAAAAEADAATGNNDSIEVSLPAEAGASVNVTPAVSTVDAVLATAGLTRAQALHSLRALSASMAASTNASSNNAHGASDGWAALAEALAAAPTVTALPFAPPLNEAITAPAPAQSNMTSASASAGAGCAFSGPAFSDSVLLPLLTTLTTDSVNYYLLRHPALLATAARVFLPRSPLRSLARTAAALATGDARAGGDVGGAAAADWRGLHCAAPADDSDNDDDGDDDGHEVARNGGFNGVLSTSRSAFYHLTRFTAQCARALRAQHALAADAPEVEQSRRRVAASLHGARHTKLRTAVLAAAPELSPAAVDAAAAAAAAAAGAARAGQSPTAAAAAAATAAAVSATAGVPFARRGAVAHAIALLLRSRALEGLPVAGTDAAPALGAVPLASVAAAAAASAGVGADEADEAAASAALGGTMAMGPAPTAAPSNDSNSGNGNASTVETTDDTGSMTVELSLARALGSGYRARGSSSALFTEVNAGASTAVADLRAAAASSADASSKTAVPGATLAKSRLARALFRRQLLSLPWLQRSLTDAVGAAVEGMGYVYTYALASRTSNNSSSNDKSVTGDVETVFTHGIAESASPPSSRRAKAARAETLFKTLTSLHSTSETASASASVPAPSPLVGAAPADPPGALHVHVLIDAALALFSSLLNNSSSATPTANLAASAAAAAAADSAAVPLSQLHLSATATAARARANVVRLLLSTGFLSLRTCERRWAVYGARTFSLAHSAAAAPLQPSAAANNTSLQQSWLAVAALPVAGSTTLPAPRLGAASHSAADAFVPANLSHGRSRKSAATAAAAANGFDLFPVVLARSQRQQRRDQWERFADQLAAAAIDVASMAMATHARADANRPLLAASRMYARIAAASAAATPVAHPAAAGSPLAVGALIPASARGVAAKRSGPSSSTRALSTSLGLGIGMGRALACGVPFALSSLLAQLTFDTPASAAAAAVRVAAAAPALPAAVDAALRVRTKPEPGCSGNGAAATATGAHPLALRALPAPAAGVPVALLPALAPAGQARALGLKSTALATTHRVAANSGTGAANALAASDATEAASAAAESATGTASVASSTASALLSIHNPSSAASSSAAAAAAASWVPISALKALSHAVAACETPDSVPVPAALLCRHAVSLRAQS